MASKRIALSLLSCCVISVCMAVQHEIKIKLNGLKNTNVYLAHYYANNTKYVEDTAYINSLGLGVFNNNRNLEQGIYLVILPDYKNFEFLVGTAQQFEIEAYMNASVPGNIKFINSPENTEYYTYRDKKNKYDGTTLNILRRMKEKLNGHDELILQQQSINARMEYFNYRESVIKKYPNTFLQKLLTSTLSEENHFGYNKFDLRVFKESAFLNTPYFERKLFYFLDTLLPQQKDTLKNNLTTIFNNAATVNYVYRYLSSALLKHYKDRKGYEDIYLYIADNYYIPFVSWDSPEKMDTLQKEVDKLRPTMVGSDAPNIYLNKYYIPEGAKNFSDTAFLKTTLWQLKADYLIVVFWDESCDSCRKHILGLYDLTRKLKNKNVVLLSMNKKMGKEEISSWLEFINKNKMYDGINASAFSLSFKNIYFADESETIYILDRNKKIIARKIRNNEVIKYLPSE